MKIMKSISKIIILKIVYISFFPLSSEPGLPEKALAFVKEKQYDDAQGIIDSIHEKGGASSKTRLIQAEIWMGKGESFYRKENWASSLTFYEKAYTLWPEHEKIRLRLHELRNKISIERQKDVAKKESISVKKSEIKHNIKENKITVETGKVYPAVEKEEKIEESRDSINKYKNQKKSEFDYSIRDILFYGILMGGALLGAMIIMNIQILFLLMYTIRKWGRNNF